MKELVVSRRRTARAAGLWYLLLAVFAPVGVLIVPAKLIVPGNASASLSNIAGSEFLFRFGIVANVVCQVAFVFLVLALYRLFEDVDLKLARLMVALVLVSVPIAFVNLLNPLAVLVLLQGGTSFARALPPGQVGALAMLFLSLQSHGVALVEVFWGLWLLPLGLLVFKSRFIPRTIGVLLVIACAMYVAHSLAWLLFPGIAASVNSVAAFFEAGGELSMVLYLLIKGTSEPRVPIA